MPNVLNNSNYQNVDRHFVLFAEIVNLAKRDCMKGNLEAALWLLLVAREWYKRLVPGSEFEIVRFVETQFERIAQNELKPDYTVFTENFVSYPSTDRALRQTIHNALYNENEPYQE